MTCQDTNNISIRFPKVGLELQPYTVDFRIDRTQLDFFEAKFSDEVGEYINSEATEENGSLRTPQPVEVVMDGDTSHRMYFRPDYVTFGETNCWIELHDPQEHLKFTYIDNKLDKVTAKQAYKTIFREANSNDVITGIEFKIPDSATSNLDEAIPTGPGGMPLLPIYFEMDDAERNLKPFTSLWRDYDEEVDTQPTQTIVDSKYHFDVQHTNGLEALYTINDALGLQSWVDDSGTLIVGLDFIEPAHHVASANDSRVWRYHDPEITPPATPVKMVIVNGGMIDAPNSTSEENAVESVLEFLDPTTDHENDLLAQGVAQRPDIIDGKIITLDKPDLSRDSLENRAIQELANEVTNNNSGSVRINPETSGTEISNWRNVDVGDFIQLVPSDDEDCQEIQQDIFLISGVKHRVDGGSWDIDINIQKWAEPTTVSTLRYFSPDSTNYYSKNDDGKMERLYTDD